MWIPWAIAIAVALLGPGASPCGAEASATAAPLRADDVQAVELWLAEHLEELETLYRHFHSHPELSLEERETAARLAQELEAAGYAVTRQVGGHGVVAVLENGSGPTLLVRGDIDALPVTEATGLAYASRVTRVRPDGSIVGVMHACGHDLHTTSLIGTARVLSALRDRWSGTLVLVGQPAEEAGRGSLAMIRDGLFERFPKPDYTLALHVEPELAAGTVGVTPGWATANVDEVHITFYGRGGHGARPHQGVDPIVASAHLVTLLQTLVSRRVDPLDPAVVTVGSIHGGSRYNVIPDEVNLQLTVRSYTDEARATLVDGIRQLAADTCRVFQCPKPPLVETREEFTPAAYNDPALSALAVAVFRQLFGVENVTERKPSMGGEDFGRYARTLSVPGLQFRLGAVAASEWRASRQPDGPPLPSLHSSRFAPHAEPTLDAGVRATTGVALAILGGS